MKCGKIASGSGDNNIKIRDLNNPINTNLSKSIYTLSKHNYSVNSFIVLKCGKIISGSWDKTIKLWDLNILTNKSILTLTEHTDCVTSLNLLKCGKMLLLQWIIR